MTSPEFEIPMEWWREKFDTVMAPAPLEMPPLREVNCYGNGIFPFVASYGLCSVQHHVICK
jgi:hypothetical protein